MVSSNSLGRSAAYEQFRNSYDSDNTTFVRPPELFLYRPKLARADRQSPQGKLHQVEYALEAVKQGSAAIGLRSATHAVLLTLKVRSAQLPFNPSYGCALASCRDDHLWTAASMCKTGD